MTKSAKWFSKTKKYFWRVFQFFDWTIGDFVRHEGLMYAGGLSFFVMFSFAPLIVLVAASIGYFLYFFGDGNESAIQGILTEISHYGEKFVPYLSDSLQSDLWSLIDNRVRLSVFGLLVLLLSASQLFRACEYVVVRILTDVRQSKEQKKRKHLRHPLASKLIFGGLLIVVAVALLTLQMLVHLFYDFLNYLSPSLAAVIGNPDEGGSISAILFSLVATTFIFTLVVKLASRKIINTWFVAFCGFVFYVMVSALGHVYGVYLDGYLQDVHDLYGSLTAFVVLVLWIYCLSISFLLCLELLKALLNYSFLRKAKV